MYLTNDDQRGYTRGGLDVITAVNLFFKGILLFPIFLLAGYIGVIMMKHMIFQGIPSITTPTAEQQQEIHDRNQGKAPAPVVVPEVVEEPVKVNTPYDTSAMVREPKVLTPADVRAKEDIKWLSEEF